MGIMQLKDLTGKRFEQLTVLSRSENKGKNVVWLCQCDCGNKTLVQANHLLGKSTSSCGKCANARTSRLYRSVWNKLFQRCYNQNNRDYNNYGGRGIKVCDEWHKYLNFRKWALENGYNDDLTIERIDSDGDYCPNNCRWATRKEQTRNRRITKKIIYNGKEIPLGEVAEIEGITYQQAYDKYVRPKE